MVNSLNSSLLSFRYSFSCSARLSLFSERLKYSLLFGAVGLSSVEALLDAPALPPLDAMIR